jgi:hypothetical protein
MPTPPPPYQFIAIARTIARGFTEQAIGHPDGEALTETARAIWRGIEVLEWMDRRAPPSMRSGRRTLSAAPVPPAVASPSASGSDLPTPSKQPEQHA